MASYVGAIESFNPYVSSIPLDAYVKVGMQKQAQYEAGVQKVQSVVDNIAGMDVANSADKEYLNNRVNELTTELNKHGSMDFSNNTFVKQLTGLATPIATDDNIINAVSSTSSIRQLQKSQQEAIKSGKAENFSIEYENATYLQPYLNSNVVGQRYAGPKNTLNGNVTETRKRFLDEVSKFKPDKSLTQSSADPIYQIQTENGYETMDKNRLSEYVMSTMSNDERELLKRSSWGDNRHLTNEQLLEKSKITDIAKSRQTLELAQHYQNLTKGFAEGSDAYNAYAGLATDYTNQYKKRVSSINENYNSIDPDKMNFQQRDQLYSNLGTTQFAQGIANGVAYQDVTLKQFENNTWKTVFGANQAAINNAVSQGQIVIDKISTNEDGSIAGFGYGANPYRDNPGGKKTKEQIDQEIINAGGTLVGTGSGATGTGAVRGPGDAGISEIIVPDGSAPTDKSAWDLGTYKGVMDNLEKTKTSLNESTYQYFKEANIDAAQYFNVSYERDPKGNGQIRRVTAKPEYSNMIEKIVAGLETAVDASLIDPKFMNNALNGKPTGNAAYDAQMQGVPANLRAQFLMPALKHVLDPKSGRTFIKDVYEKKKQYQNVKSSLANVARKYAEIQYGGDPKMLDKIRSMSDSDLLFEGKAMPGADGDYKGFYFAKIETVNGREVVNQYVRENSTDGEAEQKLVGQLNLSSGSLSNLRKAGGYKRMQAWEVRDLNKGKLDEPNFLKGFNNYLQTHISTRNEAMYTTLFTSNISKIGQAGVNNLVSAALNYQRGIDPSTPLPDEATIGGTSISLGGFEADDPTNPLARSPRLKLIVPVKDAAGKNIGSREIAVNMSALMSANANVRDARTGKRLPFVEAFDLGKYMQEANAIMMDPYNGSRLNDKVEDWNSISDNKGNKTVKYRVVWTGDNANSRAVGGEAGIGNNVSSGKAYVEVVINGKKKLLINPATGNPQEFAHPALALKGLHDTWEQSSEAELDKIYEYISKQK